MVEVRFELHTSLPPERVVEALTDFTDRRPEIWPALDPEDYAVHAVGDTWADVREGQRRPRLWAEEHYDWSSPGNVTWTVRESNFCRPGSFVSVTARDDGRGGTRGEVVWNRRAATPKGAFLAAAMKLSRGKPFRDYLEGTFDDVAEGSSTGE